MTVENISRSISTKECCRPRRGLNPRPPGLQSDGASSWATEAVQTIMKTPAKISEGLVKNCRRSCAHKIPTINLEPRTTESRILCPLTFLRKGGGKKFYSLGAWYLCLSSCLTKCQLLWVILCCLTRKGERTEELVDERKEGNREGWGKKWMAMKKQNTNMPLSHTCCK